jgi:hypothetical protein
MPSEKASAHWILSASCLISFDFLGTDETYPVKNGSYVMRCISFIGVLFVCPQEVYASPLQLWVCLRLLLTAVMLTVEWLE